MFMVTTPLCSFYDSYLSIPPIGLLREDLETGDPVFVVPLYTPAAAEPHSYSICYEIHGFADETFNFISDECTSVTAHYYEVPDPDPYAFRPFHGVDEINIQAVNNLQQCVSIKIALVNDVCKTTVGLTDLQLGDDYLQYGIRVRQMANRTRVSVPNCADSTLVMNIYCQNVGSATQFLEFRVNRGLNLRETSHGLIGKDG